jgi:hypothetical protein
LAAIDGEKFCRAFVRRSLRPFKVRWKSEPARRALEIVAPELKVTLHALRGERLLLPHREVGILNRQFRQGGGFAQLAAVQAGKVTSQDCLETMHPKRCDAGSAAARGLPVRHERDKPGLEALERDQKV